MLRLLVSPIRNSVWLSNQKQIRKALLKIFRLIILGFTLGKGVKKNIGGAGHFRLDPHFIFYDYSAWGSQHNNGFAKALEMSKGKAIVFDVGAHIGLYSLPLSNCVEENGRIFAFEASDSNVKHLISHMRLNKVKNVEVVASFVGESTNRELTFYESESTDGMNSAATPRKRQERYKKRIMREICLDSFSKNRNVIPDVIKIDVEGAEGMVLRGSQKILEQYRPVLFLSLHPRHLESLGETADEVYDYLTDLNYQVFNMDGTPVTDFRLEEYLGVPVEHIKNLPLF